MQVKRSGRSHNRYSYVYNSPLSATDPSGYFLKWVARKIRKEYKRSAIFRAVVGIAAAYFAGGFAAGMYEGYAATAILDGGIAATIGGSVSLTSKIIAGAVGGFSGGLASSGGDLKAAFQGAVTGGAFGYVGTFSNPLANYAGHALVGCASGAMNGGGGEGCARGTVSQVISKWVTNNTAGRNWHPAAHFAVATISGGTMSVITGGKFATGAQTAAFGYLFNEVAAAMKGEMQHTQRYHEYTLDNKICDYSQSGCSLANLKNDFGALSWPGSNVTEPSKTGDIRFARYGILLGGFVTQEVFDDGTMVVNSDLALGFRIP